MLLKFIKFILVNKASSKRLQIVSREFLVNEDGWQLMLRKIVFTSLVNKIAPRCFEMSLGGFTNES